MRPALRLFAAVQKGTTTYLEAGAPTGLTGLRTAPAPRTTLIYLYNTTLEKLQTMPSSSVYRASAEALTRHRLSIIEAAQPAGLAEWQDRVKHVVDAYPDVYKRVPVGGLASAKRDAENQSNIAWKRMAQRTTQFGEYDPEPWKGKPQHEGVVSLEEGAKRADGLKRDPLDQTNKIPEIEAEPALTAEQIGEIENRIGAGLIEEVIAVAEGELRVVETMIEHKAWEDLEEKPVPGQWEYFQRDTHTK